MLSTKEDVTHLREVAARLRINSILSTSAAGSGHPTSCASAAEIVAALFFAVMNLHNGDPDDPRSDAFILSKGHAAPLLYAALAEAGAISADELMSLRELGSKLEGHPTTRVPSVKAATGSLGQGLSIGVGISISSKYLDKTGKRTYVLLGDGEVAEGSIWEAAEIASHYELDNLCAVIDLNRLGQSEPTMLKRDKESLAHRWRAFGWEVLTADGHDLEQLLGCFERARGTRSRPTVILAETIKGKGISETEDQNGFHGKPLSAESAAAAVDELKRGLPELAPRRERPAARIRRVPDSRPSGRAFPAYAQDTEGKTATRKAFGQALAAAGDVYQNIVVLDGDVKNSTYTSIFEQRHPSRFFQMYIAEQNMIGAAVGLAAEGKIPFVATFASFLSRGYDVARMAAISRSNIKLVGSHVGVSIGEDGPSQMGLEDLAEFCAQPNFTVLYPSDAVSAWSAVRLALETDGPVYLRTSRPGTPALYAHNESFALGNCKVVRQQLGDQATIVAGGVTLFEALDAADMLERDGISARVIDIFSVQPIDRAGLVSAVRQTGGRVVVVEDHYSHGGIGDAVADALSEERPQLIKLAVRQVPGSGSGAELLDQAGISSRQVVQAVTALVRG